MEMTVSKSQTWLCVFFNNFLRHLTSNCPVGKLIGAKGKDYTYGKRQKYTKEDKHDCSQDDCGGITILFNIIMYLFPLSFYFWIRYTNISFKYFRPQRIAFRAGHDKRKKTESGQQTFTFTIDCKSLWENFFKIRNYLMAYPL